MELFELSESLLAWYIAARRDLPWRHTEDPYAIWISEVMLQQTRAVAVIPYYERFLSELPTVRALCDVPEDRLMKLWEGLGYYNRARNLARAARKICAEYGGALPATPEELIRLPGFGPYTSASVAAFAFGYPAVPVDGNVLRVFARFYAIPDDLRAEETRRRIRALANQGIPQRAGDYGQALIELGATVCLPGTPDCASCPLREGCRACALGLAETLPHLSGLRPRRIEERTVLLCRAGGRYLLRKRPEKGLLAGLYEFPSLAGFAEEREALAAVRRMGLSPIRILPAGEAKHIFTHVEWHMKGYRIECEEPERDGLLLASTAELRTRYAVPSAFAFFLSILPGFD